MNLRPEFLQQVIGKTIAGIVTREGVGAGPQNQLFVIFTDNTYLEFYGDIDWSAHLESGDVETVKQYASRFGGTAVVIT